MFAGKTKPELRKESGSLLKRAQKSFNRIIQLYFVLSILAVLAIAAVVRYDVFRDNSIVIENAHAASIVKPETIEQPVEIADCASAITVYSKEYGVSTDLLTRIMKSESGNDARATNGKSTARGCFQFLFGTWEYYGKMHWGEDFYTKIVYSPKDNVELAAWAISTKGTGDWNASKHNWSK